MSSEKFQNINFMAMDINTVTIVITMEGTDKITEKVTRTQSIQTNSPMLQEMIGTLQWPLHFDWLFRSHDLILAFHRLI